MIGNYWRVDVELIPEDKLRRQNTSVSRNVDNGYSYASGKSVTNSVNNFMSARCMQQMLTYSKLRFEWCILSEIWSNSKKIWQGITQFNDWYWTCPISTIRSILSYSTSILWGRKCSIYTTGESYLEYRIRSRLGVVSCCVLHVGINLGQ